MTLIEGCGGAEINESYLRPEKFFAVVLWDDGAESGWDIVPDSFLSKIRHFVPYKRAPDATVPRGLFPGEKGNTKMLESLLSCVNFVKFLWSSE